MHIRCAAMWKTCRFQDMPMKPETYKPIRRRQARRVRDSNYDAGRPSAARRGYDRRWRKVRKKKLALDPLCEHCKLRGRTTPATDVDHVVPLNRGGAGYAMSNLQSLCRSCHNRKTRSQHENRCSDHGAR